MSADAEHDVAPAGEVIHLPDPSLLPIATAVGVTLTLVGLTLGTPVLITGLIILVVSVVRWIRSTRSDIDELPLEH
ncbi:MAG TPA: hypothetical protein VHE14_03545 [Solirubrobacteraceae bacterium]|nr:hypothetical protein [Solirubrobacteraceae bacterium]